VSYELSDFAVDASVRAYYERLYEEARDAYDAEHADRVEAAEQRRAAALRRFRRAMKRHEKRARGMGLRGFAHVFRNYRIDAAILGPSMADHVRGIAAGYSRDAWLDPDARRRGAFLYDRAADAVARLRADLAAVGP
jgi:hypothetical protein